MSGQEPALQAGMTPKSFRQGCRTGDWRADFAACLIRCRRRLANRSRPHAVTGRRRRRPIASSTTRALPSMGCWPAILPRPPCAARRAKDQSSFCRILLSSSTAVRSQEDRLHQDHQRRTL